MYERLPKDCSISLDNFAKVFGEDVTLGFSVSTTATKNKFILSLKDQNDNIYLLSVGSYNEISVSGIGALINEIWPDFLLKPSRFIPIEKFINVFKIDKEKLAKAIFKRIRELFTYFNRWAQAGAFITPGAYINPNPVSSGRKTIMTDKFKNFDEFLVWIDLNVK